MAKSIRAHLELASEKDVRTICAKDAPDVSSSADDYIKQNMLGYYVIVNTWLMMIQQWSRNGWMDVLEFMSTYGLFAFIKKCDETVAEIIHGADVSGLTFSIARNIYRDVLIRGPILGVPQDPARSTLIDPRAGMLQILRYGKRFSPLGADKLRTASLESFVQLQRDLKYEQRRPTCEFINSYVREELLQLVDWDSLCDELNNVDISDIEFTPGVGFETKADLVSKLRHVAKARVEYFPMPFGIPLVSHQGCDEVEYWGKYDEYEVHKVRIVAVPKNYKTARIIAPEDTVRQALARRYFSIMDKYLDPRYVTLHNQEVNQTLARKASVTGFGATIDLKSASDRITSTILTNLLPDRFVRLMHTVLPTHYVYKDTVRLLQSAATMGNSVTFWLESILFLGITRACSRFVSKYTGVDYDEWIHVYGDDIVVASEVAPTLMEWLDRLGFVVNDEKSFYNWSGDYAIPMGCYRESCGEEYVGGDSVASIYFPRFPLDGVLGGQFSSRWFRDTYRGTRIDTMTAIIDLQHKLYAVSDEASRLLAQLVKESDKRMTTSSPDEGLADLYSYESRPTIVPAPAGEVVVENGKRFLRKKVVEGQVREGHLGPAFIVPRPKSVNASDELLVSLYNYQQFLKLGPRYDTPLDKLLGVSSPPISYAEACHLGDVKWVLIK